MIKSYFKIAFRNLLKHKHISFINIFGLAFSMACCLLIVLYAHNELSYDKHHKDADNIYRVVTDLGNTDGSSIPNAATPPALAPALQNKLPEIESVTAIYPGLGLNEKYLVSYVDKKFYEKRFYSADSNIFKVFTFDFLKGNPKAVIQEPHSIVITESAAKKYFGSEDPIGKAIGIGKDWSPRKITAVIKDISNNSHFHFDFLFVTFFGNEDSWGWHNFYTYIKVKPGTNVASLDGKIQAIYKETNTSGKDLYYTQALTAIHLNSNLQSELESNSDKLYILIFSLIGLFIILIACINYVNLSTAQYSLRAKEIGVRKVSGALRISLIKQFLLESVLTVLLAFVISVGLAELFLPAINQLTQKNLSLFSSANTGLLVIAIAAAIVTGLGAGVYPALYLSSFKPVLVLKGTQFRERGGFSLRKSLVVFQFVISTFLITGTIVIYQQISLLQTSKLGLNHEQVMVIEGIGSYPSRPRYESFQNSLLQIPGVIKVAGADGVIGGPPWTIRFRTRGSQNDQLINSLAVGEDFVDVMGIEIKEGRNFRATDTLNLDTKGGTDRLAGGIILNEKAVKDLSLSSPVIGRQLVWRKDKDTTWYLDIVGVVKDFHFTSLRNEIKSFAFMRIPDRELLLTVKLSTGNINTTTALIAQKWKVFSRDRPFEFYFLDETFDRMYQGERRFSKIFLYTTILAIVVACLGLFGLTAFTIEQRVKEIGIRKVMGASVTSIVTLLSKEFVGLTLISCVIALPVGWYVMNQWLLDFAYRVNISWWVFVAAGSIVLLIAVLTVSFQAIKAAIANPIKSLRTE